MLLHVMFFLTMVFQVFEALTTLPYGITDAALYEYGQSYVKFFLVEVMFCVN